MPHPATYLFAGGGTGGHLFPGVAIAEEIQRREPDSRIVFAGCERELERTILARHPFHHRPLSVEPLRELIRNPLKFVTRNGSAWIAARRLLHAEQPRAVVGLGGYASAPLVWAASRRGIPVVLLEQNLIPGRATRWLSRSADMICASFDETKERLPKSANVAITGNPLRREITDYVPKQSTSLPCSHQILVLGGSQGADSLNDAVLAAMPLLGESRFPWSVIHQTGPRQLEAVRRSYEALSINAVVESFFEDMMARYQSVSLVISRAGATTLAELACCGLPMILLPYPHATDNHQSANAQAYVAHGAAICLEHLSSPEQTAAQLATLLQDLFSNDARRAAMTVAARRCARPSATKEVVDRIVGLGARNVSKCGNPDSVTSSPE